MRVKLTESTMGQKTIQRKICLLGDFSVGKTSLVRRYVEGVFDDRYLSTIGVKISRRTVDLETHSIKLLIWDLAGGDDYDQVTSAYLRGAAGLLMVCDLTRPTTLLTIEKYQTQAKSLNLNCPIVLLANKKDLVDERTVTDEDLARLASRLNAPFLLTSAKLDIGVEEGFSLLVNNMENR